MKKTLTKLSQDSFLKPYMPCIKHRAKRIKETKARLCSNGIKLKDFASAHEYYGLHKTKDGNWIFRELAPNATNLWLVGDFSNWEKLDEFKAKRIDKEGTWEISIPSRKISHGQHYQIFMEWDGGCGQRIPAYARRVVQDSATNIFSAQVWEPQIKYTWKCKKFRLPTDFTPIIYETHIGMAQEKPGVGIYDEFRLNTLPRIADAGYNTIQIMAIMEHPYYGSFGYQVSNFFACSSRFGTPEELKELIDDAHSMGIAVIMDIIHSHSVRNELEGLAKFDGTDYLYFHTGEKGHHPVWDSSCFDYGKLPTLHMLLSNCRYWLDEFHFDGYRFDGVTSMLYAHHGLGINFTSYDQYFNEIVDEDAYTYLALANDVIHSVRKDAITIAEDVSGMPGLGAPTTQGGAGFNYRLAMGITETWGKLAREVSDENWDLFWIWHELTNRRTDEQTISYVECHDQALVGGKTLFFEMSGSAIYDSMHKHSDNLTIQRAIALHKMARLATLATANSGYLNFMGNEFGHPEWIDFPREGNNFSYDHARRQWSLRDDSNLSFSSLADFDKAMIKLLSEENCLYDTTPRQLLLDNDKKLLAFERNNLFFIFNFHHSNSYEDLSIIVPPGEYELVLDSDDASFSGHNRIQKPQTFYTIPKMIDNECVLSIKVYAPSRTALVLKRK